MLNKIFGRKNNNESLPEGAVTQPPSLLNEAKNENIVSSINAEEKLSLSTNSIPVVSIPPHFSADPEFNTEPLVLMS